jgi:hypothetical protein
LRSRSRRLHLQVGIVSLLPRAFSSSSPHKADITLATTNDCSQTCSQTRWTFPFCSTPQT